MSASLIKRLPEGRAGQVLAVGMTLAALGLVWSGCVAPLTGLFAAREAARADQAGMLAHMQMIAADLPSLRRIAREAKADRTTGSASALIPGATDAIAAANLQNALQDLAAGSGVLPSSVEVLPALQRGAFRRIGLQIEATTTWPILISLMKAINDSALGLVVDDLSLHALSDGSKGNGIDASHPALDASFMVFAFRAGTEAGDHALTRSVAVMTNPAN
ncbi:hypothetical protein ACELLULO517_23385 [Acidisoma cellulosilytica]|uniref:Uncharacterized protein n=1 Tax=Acidisoma cellulosilyticum TaxID=2802395 RepID=A0A963Z7C6_9PROT|nr:type II secretion system protein GspM [Acidisoma cellulosilyticum]MCB8883212.1 hypothetical protein [Acidisoma cellulosilyticum]